MKKFSNICHILLLNTDLNVYIKNCPRVFLKANLHALGMQFMTVLDKS